MSRISEKHLQEKLIELVKNNALYEAVNNRESSNEALNSGSDENHIPHLSIDDLLKKKYSKSCRRVLESIIDCEIITGDAIKNISLNQKEKLFPDVILFNRETAQIILIENKVSGKTGREAITEIYGYVNEIKNHLPFSSHYDISIIIVSSEFDTLLDHSISSNILSSNISLLCLLPNFYGSQLTFDIHYPKSWTHIGQNNLPQNSLVSYSWSLDKKKTSTDFEEISIINLAKELIVNNAERHNSSGFLSIWENGMAEFYGSRYVITIYVINSFSFLPNADLYGFIYRSSSLSEYLKNYSDDLDGIVHPKSLFNVMDEAISFLEDYYDIRLHSPSEWSKDLTNDKNRLERKPILFDSWGMIGDYVRYFYFHPAVRKHYFSKTDDSYRGHLNPIIGLQIINLVTKNTIFNDGHFFADDLFEFGRQLCSFNYACKNAVHAKNETINNALLFWSVLDISQSLKEILFYASNTVGIEQEVILDLHLNLDSKKIKSDFRNYNDKFSENFQQLFLPGDDNWLYRKIFEFGYFYGQYFSNYFSETIPKDDQILIEKDISEFLRKFINSAVLSAKNRNSYLNKAEILFMDRHFTKGRFSETSFDKISEIIDRKSNNFMTAIFTDFLQSFAVSLGTPYRELKELFVPNSIDWKWMRESLAEKFNQGLRYGAINIELNGNVSISQIDKEYAVMQELKNENEVYLKKYTSTTGYIYYKVSWEDIESGKAFLS